MLVKEYRILLPLTVEEYRIAQLYMIQKKSRLDSSGEGSGVEIITNKPYTDGPGGSGQYTFKIYHIGNKIPVWIRSVLPSTAFEAHEESWNAYPFTKTRYSCPLMDRFSVEVETRYVDDAGTQTNVFQLTKEELKHRVVDVMDFVKDPISNHDYCAEEDPKVYQSKKTGRGPLNDGWVEQHLKENKPVMCAYKICRVEFRYWGLQTRAERWIHDLALRGTMMRAHRQAWAWQDEWVDLTMADIRRLEAEAQTYLSNFMSSSATGKDTNTSSSRGEEGSEEEEEGDDSLNESEDQWSSELLVGEGEDNLTQVLTPKPDTSSCLIVLMFHGDVFPEAPADSKTTDVNTLRSTLEAMVASHYPQLKSRVQVLKVTCGKELAPTLSLLKEICPSFGFFHPSLALLLASNTQTFHEAVQGAIARANTVLTEFLNSDTGRSFKDGEVFAVGDYVGGLLMYEALAKVKKERQHVPIGRNASSHSANLPMHAENDGDHRENNSLSCSLDEYNLLESEANNHSDHSDHSSFNSSVGMLQKISINNNFTRNLSAPPSATFRPPTPNRLSSSSAETSDHNYWPSNSAAQLCFKPTTAFLLGSPLGLVLMQRKMAGRECDQLFNLYYSLDSCGSRLEPVLNAKLAALPAVIVPRYQRFPFGDGHQNLFSGLDPIIGDSSMFWGTRRIDQELYCPPEMVSLPSTVLPNILHASYWESKDVASFILRQFVRSDDQSFPNFSVSNCAKQIPAMDCQLPIGSWNRRRTRFKIVNLTANHRANDLIVVDDSEQIIHARFCYGPMDLVALSQENILVYTCPSGGEWTLNSKEVTDNHGRLNVAIKQKLPIGINAVRMVVQGDHSFLNMYIAVLSICEWQRSENKTRLSRCGTVLATTGLPYNLRHSQTRYATETSRLWLAQHNFPHGLLFFTPCLSTDPLKQKAQHLRHLIDLGIRIQAAYGSSKDVNVYSSVGIATEQIFKVGGSKRRGCIALEDGYAQHLKDLVAGEVKLAQPVADPNMVISKNFFTTSSTQHNPQLSRGCVQRTDSFAPRSGKYRGFNDKKNSSQLSISTR
uniref:DDHD domain-containing protein n=1 Tax=Ditylenchus dipsaci TaxID=166011 RepID=A0A915DU56_9BILA